jgi:molybdate transport system ATP-binding protein
MSAATVIAMRYALRHPSFRLDVDVEIPMHGITGVYGRSGAGKTSLLRCIAGLETPDKGRLVVAGETWQDRRTSRPVHRREIGYVFQEPRLFDHLDVRGNIEFGARRRRGGRVPSLDAVVELLGLEQLLGRKPGALSGGEAQRVAIARALLCAPRFVLMDEPLASLDQARKNEILPFLERLHAESSIPVIYVSHNIDEICRLCDHLLVIEDGRIDAAGELQDVLMRTDLPILAGLEAGSVIEGTVAGYDDEDQLLRLSTSAGELWVPGEGRALGSPLRLRVRANDVSLCLTRPTQSTILNILPATVEAIQPEAGGSDLVRLGIGNDKLLARVTRRSVREIGIAEGDELFAQIKSVAVRSQSTGRA